MNEIVAFNQTKADLATFKAAEEKLEFDCETPEGITKLRSHVYTLRQRKAAFEKLRVSTKAEALQACNNVDAQAKVINAGFTEMIDARNKPLKEIAEREEAEKQAAIDKIRADRLAEEKRQQDELEKREATVALKEAEMKAKEDAITAKEAVAKAEIERIENTRHRAEIETEVIKGLHKYIGSNSVLARNIISGIQSGEIPNVTINY